MSAVKTITASPHRALSLARATWLAVALLAIALFLVSAWAYYQVLLSDPFLGSAVKPAVTDLEAVRLGLDRVGLTLQTYAAILLAGQGIITATCCILSALIFWRRSTERLAWIMSLILLMIGTLVPAQVYALAKLYPPLSFLSFAVNQIGAFSNFVLLWIFPDGRFVPTWSRWTLLGVFVLGIPTTLFRDSALAPLGALIAFVLITSAMIAQVYRYVRVSGPIERQQTRWVVFGLIAAPLLWIGGALLPAVFPALTRTSEMRRSTTWCASRLIVSPVCSFRSRLGLLSCAIAYMTSTSSSAAHLCTFRSPRSSRASSPRLSRSRKDSSSL